MKPLKQLDPSTYLFKTVLERTCAGFANLLKAEFPNLTDERLKKFQYFPRSLPEYSSLISTLSRIASVNIGSILAYLCNTFYVLLKNKQKSFFFSLEYAVEFDRENKLHRLFLRYVEITFLTDLISTIVSNYNQVSTEDENLLNLGFLLASNSIGQPTLCEIVLPQYASIINRITKRNFPLFYDLFSQLIINKPEPYFILLKYVNLDETPTSFDFLGVLYDYMNREKRKKILTSEMLSSLATILVSFQQDINDPTINDFLVFARNVLKSKDCPTLIKYGCLEILSVLKAKSNYKGVQELKEFFKTNILPILDETKDGFYCALKCYYLLVFSNYIESEKMLNTWTPRANDSADISVPILNIKDEEKKNEIKEMSSIFCEYLDRSNYEYDEKMGTILRHLLLHFAQLDLDFFMNIIEPHFLGADSGNKFTLFLSCVSAINRDDFVKDPVLLAKFNATMSDLTFKRLSKVSSETKAHRFYAHKSGELNHAVEVAEAHIKATYEKWGISPGHKSNVMPRSDSIQISENIYIPWQNLVEILPYFSNSQDQTPNKWTEMLVELASINNSSISKPAMMILEHNLDESNEKGEICSNIVDMITLKQESEKVFICLNLLLHTCQSREPFQENEKDKLFEKIEYVSFLCLSSDHPLIRRASYNLMIIINKMKMNEGIYSIIEPHIQAIESNVKHNILLKRLPMRPEQDDIFGEEIFIDQAIDSPYTSVWLFYLSEISRIVCYSHYTPIISRIMSLIPEFTGHMNPKVNLPQHFGHLNQGLMTVFFSILSIRNNVDTTFFIYDILRKEELERCMNFINNEEMEYEKEEWVKEQLTTLVNMCTSNSLTFYFETLAFANYTILHTVFSLLNEKFTKNQLNVLQNIETLYLMIKNAEAIPSIRRQEFPSLLLSLQTVETQLNISFKNRSVSMNKTFFNQVLFYLLSKANVLNYLETTLPSKQKFSTTFFLENIITNFKSQLHKQDAEQKKTSHQIIAYAAYTLSALFRIGPGFGVNSIHENTLSELFETLIICQEHGYNVLQPFLEKDFEAFINYYLDYCYNGNQRASDIFFNSIYIVVKSSQPNTKNFNKAFSMPDTLLLVGMYKLKTGNSCADQFLRIYMKMIIEQKMNSMTESFNNDLNKDDVTTLELIYKYFSKYSQAIVSIAFDLLTDSKHPYKGSIKVIIDVIVPFIKNFKLLPNQLSCIPHSSYRMTPYKFLARLHKTTEAIQKQDLSSIVIIWKQLLMVKENCSIVLPFLFEIPEQDLKKEIFSGILGQFKEPQILDMLMSRLQYSFYAYCEIQKAAIYQNEMWIVSVITKHIHLFLHEKYMPVLIHFSLLFHHIFTQVLLKKICKKYGITYTRRTLSNDSLRYLVEAFIKSFKTSDKNEDLIEKWALEAMRWVIGSKSIKIATTSLVILNSLSCKPDNKNIAAFSNGICQAVTYFLAQTTEKDQQTLYFINETFLFFLKFFEGHEIFAFNYLSSFFKFTNNVDAYFDKMIPLYTKCATSPITKEIAAPSLIHAIRPIFNELETDGKAMEVFKRFKESNPLIDLQYVSVVLSPLDNTSFDHINNLLTRITIKDINHILGHYAFMALTASIDVLKRIFTVSTLILKKFLQIREEIQKNLRESISDKHPMSSSLSKEPLKLESTGEIKSRDTYEAFNTEIKNNVLSSLYKSALDIVTQEDEAVDFICELSKVEPLISPIVAFVNDEIYKREVGKVITRLATINNKESEIVTLTMCQSLESISNLLNKDSRPNIQPFSSEHEFMESLKKDINSTPVRHFHKIVKSMADNCAKLGDNFMSRLSPTTYRANFDREFKKLNLPTQIYEDKNYFDPVEPVDSPLFSPADFVKLGTGTVRSTLSRHSSVKLD